MAVKLTDAELALFRKVGAEGGKARAANCTPAELRAIAMKGVKARRQKAAERKRLEQSGAAA